MRLIKLNNYKRNETLFIHTSETYIRELVDIHLYAIAIIQILAGAVV